MASNASERGREAHRRLQLELSRKALIKTLDERKRAEVARRKVTIARPSQRVFQTQQRDITQMKRQHEMERAFEKVFSGGTRRVATSLLRAQPTGWSQVPPESSSDTEQDAPQAPRSLGSVTSSSKCTAEDPENQPSHGTFLPSRGEYEQ